MSDWTTHRARLAVLTRHNPDDPRIPEARRDLRAAKLAEHIEQVVNAAPPLTDQQISALVGILRGGAK